MALNFGILQPVNIGSQFMAGQQQAQQNELAQQQSAMRQQEMEMRKQEMGMRQQEAATQAEDRATKLADAAKRNTFLTNLSAKMQQGGHELNRETLSSMLNYGLQSKEESLVRLASEGLKALDEQKQFADIMGGGAPAAVRPQVAPGAMGSGTFDPNAPAPVAPVNALAPAAAASAVAPVNALAPTDVSDMRRKRDQLLAMGTTRSIAAANALDRDIALASKTSETPELVTMRALGYPPTQAGYQAYRDAQRQERMLTPAEEAQRVRIAQASRAVTSKEDKAPSGYRFTKTGELEAIPGGPAAKVKEPTVSEQNASYNINRVLNAATEIKNVTTKDPSALAPGAAEATAQSMGMGGAANVARSSNRQIVYGAQRDALDALLYLATGAAYNKEQLQGAWDSYMPAYTDDTATRQAKQERLGTLLDDAKTRAGKAWTPKMETAMKSLMAPAAGTAAPAAGGKLSQAEQTELDALRKRFGK